MAYLIKQKQPNAFIPDNNENGLLDSITFFRKGEVKDVQLKVNISHPFNGDLEIFLKSPNGKKPVLVHGRTGQQEKNLNVTFSGEVLAQFIGEETSGEWTLCVKDHAVGDQGYLQNWSLRVNCDAAGSESAIPSKKGKKVVSQQLCESKGKIQDISASVEIEGAPIGDLQVTLKGPKKSVVLHDQKGGKKKSLAKTYTAKKDLSAFIGTKSDGVWSLEVKTAKGAEAGRIKSWNVDLKLA